MSQGYLTLATGDRRFFDAAANVALSVKLNDPERPISLLCDDAAKLTEAEKSLFDRVIVALPGTLGVGCAGKLDVPNFLPYGETMFLDSDCLILKRDMDRHWAKLANDSFNVAGESVQEGEWYTFDIANVCKALDIPHMVKMNSGVMYFRKGEALDTFMQEVENLRETAHDILVVQHRDMNAQVADEPFWGAAMARSGLLPTRYVPEEGSVMETTYMARRCRFDPVTQTSSQDKSTGYWMLGRFFSKGWVAHSPTIAHFIRFKPRGLYRDCVNKLRDRAEMARTGI